MLAKKATKQVYLMKWLESVDLGIHDVHIIMCKVEFVCEQEKSFPLLSWRLWQFWKSEDW